MARQARLIVAGVPVHVVHRGVDRMPCLPSDKDRLIYLALLRELAPVKRCQVHAYCLMTNHVHLLLTPLEERACTDLMHAVAHRYSQFFNRKYGRSGPLWEGRYRSCVVEKADYIMACYRYIERNPVRAHLVQHPSQYPWSSYLANAAGHHDPLITPHEVFTAVGRAAYVLLVSEDIDPEAAKQIRESTMGGYPIASDEMKASLAAGARRRLNRELPGPKTSASEKGSGPVPDLFSGGGAS